jgi:protein-S-isoprenylcysteine O-methyltransferase Ste14
MQLYLQKNSEKDSRKEALLSQRLELRVPPPVVMVAAILLMWGLSAAAPGLAFDFPGRRWAAAILIAAGLALGIAAFLQFRRADTTINPMTPDETRAIVTDGLYGVSRNPIYVADVVILAGCALLFANALAFVAAALFIPYVDRFQIRPEERALRARFGGPYETYCREVRRWL